MEELNTWNNIWKVSQVALTAFYNTATQGFATTFFNQTITIVEQPRLIDLELIFLWLLLLSLLGGGGESCSINICDAVLLMQYFSCHQYTPGCEFAFDTEIGCAAQKLPKALLTALFGICGEVSSRRS